MTIDTLPPPAIAIRGRSFMALILAPEPPLEDWFAALDQQMQRSASFFADRPVVVNFRALPGAEEFAVTILDELAARGLNIISAEGVDAAVLSATPWERLPSLRPQRENRDEPDRVIPVPDDYTPPPPATAVPSLLVERPVRSGQSILFEEGDITIIGSVASGAEIIAGGSIHVYGALRGRAIAGLRTGPAARIFCRKLLAELISIDGLYYAPEHWGDGLHGRAVQIRHEDGELKLAALD